MSSMGKPTNLFGTNISSSQEKIPADPDELVDNANDANDAEWEQILQLLEDESHLDASMSCLFDEDVFNKVNEAYTLVLQDNLQECDTGRCIPMSVNKNNGSPAVSQITEEGSQLGSPSLNRGVSNTPIQDNQTAQPPLSENTSRFMMGTPAKAMSTTGTPQGQSPSSHESSTGSRSTASSIAARSLQEDIQFKEDLKTLPAGNEMHPGDEDANLVKNSDNVSLAFHSVGLSVLSQELRGANIKNLETLFKKGKATNVYKVLANILFRRNVEIDVRKEAEHGKPAEKQMREVWGNLVTNNAKVHEKTMCYLCGGPIVNTQGGVSPEMEHKLPCAVFYGSFDSIYRTYGDILLKWLYFLEQLPNDDNDNNTASLLYNTINGTSGESSFDGDVVTTEFDKLYSAFITWLDTDDNKKQGLLFTPDERISFKYTLNAYLNEFAYSHHFCNQLKSNHDLGDEPTCTDYFAALNAAAVAEDINVRNKFVAACPRPEKATHEWVNIRIGLGITENLPTGTGVNVETRKTSVLAQMKYIKNIATEHANDLNLTKKRSMIRAIKEIIRNSNPIDAAAAMKGNDGKKVTKKVRIMLNNQATNIAHDLAVNIGIPEPNQNNATKASVFLKMLNALPEGPAEVKTSAGITPNNRGRPRLVDDIVTNVLPYYVDNATTILQNAYDVHINAKRSIDSSFVIKSVKMKIKERLSQYAGNLSNIVTNLNNRLNTFNVVANEEWTEVAKEADNMIKNMNSISQPQQLTTIQEGEEGSQDNNLSSEFESPSKKTKHNPNTGGSRRSGTRRRYRKKGTTRKRKPRKNASKKRGRKRARTRRKTRKSKR